MATNTNQIPNDVDPTKPFIIVNFQNTIKLTSTNYITWKTQIKSILVGYDLFKFLDGNHLAPPQTITTTTATEPNPAYSTWMRQDQLLFGALVGTLAINVAHLVTQAETTQVAWKILEETYAKPSRGHINQLKHKLNNLKKGTLTITEFMQQIKARMDLLASLGKKQDPEDIITCVLNGLDSSFQSVIDGVKARDDKIRFEELHEKLINKELEVKMNFSNPTVPTSAMTMQSKNRSKQHENRPQVPTSSMSLPSQPYSPWKPQNQYNQQPFNHITKTNQSSPRPFLGKWQWCRQTGHVVSDCQIVFQTIPNLRPPSPNRPPNFNTQPYYPRQPPQAHTAATSNP